MSVDVPHSGKCVHTLTAEEMFCLEGCRTYKQYHDMRRGFEEELCAFCHPDPELNRVVWEDECMMIWHVHPKLMRKELRLHILIVPKRHVRFLADLSLSEWISVGLANERAKGLFGYTGGLFHAREGDMRNNAGTVPHLHINIFEPNGTGDVRVPVFKDPVDRKENRVRAERFATSYEQGVTPSRFEELVTAGILTKDGYQASQL
jgi:diadenosine tetraphosphate (Ap4A) HIT family hydrolase